MKTSHVAALFCSLAASAMLAVPSAHSAEPTGGLVPCLAKTMAGQPVVAVDPSPRTETIQPVFREGDSLLSRLQAVGEAASTPDVRLIPFAVRGVWALAPEDREEVRADFAGMTALDACSRGLLFDIVLGGLTKEQVRALATGQGIAASRLSKAGRDALAHALRPPLSALRYGPVAPSGKPARPKSTTLARFEALPDLASLRLRARLRLDAPRFPYSMDGKTPRTLMIPETRSLPELATDSLPSAEDFFSTRRFPALALVPNSLKLSDLDGRALQKPIGLHGATTLGAVLDRAAVVTGQKLSAVKEWQDLSVFVGRDDLPTGDVLDGLRLGLEAAFRRLGDTDLLVWDRRGLGALQALVNDGTRDLDDGRRKLTAAADRGAAWKDLVRALSFDAESGVALEPAQRAALFGPPANDPAEDGAAEDRNEYRFSDLTPSQQETVRKLARSGRVLDPPDANGHFQPPRPVRDEEIEQIIVTNRATVEVQVKLPGAGWTRVPDSWQAGQFTGAGERFSFPWDADPDDTEGISPEYLKAKVARPPAAWIGVLVGPLGPTRLAEVVPALKRHDVGVLFYPLLVEGYATFPSATFPLHPALRGKNGFSAAASEAKKAGLRLVGVVSTLAWQPEGEPAHWLRKHPEWIDVDVAGRTRLERLASGADSGLFELGLSGAPFARANYVRPAEPAVRARLEVLVGEAARLPGLSGLCFTEWTAPYDLGCAPSERLAAFTATGMDPIDRSGTGFHPRSTLAWLPFAREMDIKAFVKQARAPSLALVGALTARAKALRKDWRVYWDGSAEDATARPDEVLAIGADAGAPGSRILPMPSRKTILASHYPAALADVPYMSVINKLLGLGWGRTEGKGVIYDYREAPETLSEGLRWLAPSAGTTTKSTKGF